MVVASGMSCRLGCLEAHHTVASAVYSAANLSGGHITPSVTIATMVTGHIGIVKGLLYMLSQVGCTLWPKHLEQVFINDVVQTLQLALALPVRHETLDWLHDMHP